MKCGAGDEDGANDGVMQYAKLPNDAEGRSWVISTPDQESVPEKALIATLISSNKELQLQILGTAFVIGVSDGGNKALCMCAAHSLQHVKATQNEYPSYPIWTPPPDLQRALTEYLTPETIKAFFLIDGEVVVCEIGQLNYIGGNDIALLTVEAPDGINPFRDRFGLDFAIPQVGAEVIVLGNDISLNPNPAQQQGRLGLTLHARHGVVTELKMGPVIPGQSFVFRTTIPIPPGMSGSPVFLSLTKGASMVVCGVVSSDLSATESFTSFLIPGESAMSMLWPSIGLGIMGDRDDGVDQKYMSLAYLARLGFVADHTSRAKLNIQQTKKSTEIIYQDESHGIHLTTTGHPNADEE